MKNKYGPRYFKPDFMEMKDHWAVGTQWPVKGSRGDDYTVEWTDKDFTCYCMGMTMHGKCKHTRAIAERWQQASDYNFSLGA